MLPLELAQASFFQYLESFNMKELFKVKVVPYNMKLNSKKQENGLSSERLTVPHQ